ncbi:hypothetical protein [Mycoplasmopsis gallopavonis]|uniref:Uncharacterized protein n=1 Tax=Mycoplasmopsis gallopavonis TaxID=76629 RepID=A0A449B0P3_9BACT|nr:hypothetical protein [Mycoplasmopsis gallopavonis]RIV16998.1 hypothetical protein D1113_00030 [Mycoplasmopsis gallopavonis]VEU73297.1 Uncharacterised protein [Mycoplasmopsis gallopavonis]
MKNLFKNHKIQFILATCFIIGLCLGLILGIVLYKNVSAQFAWYGWIVCPIGLGLFITLLVYGFFNLFGIWKRIDKKSKS